MAAPSAKKRNLAEMSVDDFLTYGIDSDSGGSKTSDSLDLVRAKKAGGMKKGDVNDAKKVKQKKMQSAESTKKERPVKEKKLTKKKKTNDDVKQTESTMNAKSMKVSKESLVKTQMQNGGKDVKAKEKKAIQKKREKDEVKSDDDMADDEEDIDDEEEEEEDSDDDDQGQQTKVLAGERHKQQMERLKENDPEFYKFLKEEDQDLLDFDLSGSDYDDDSEDDEDAVHQLPDKLEVDSDNDSVSGEESNVAMDTAKSSTEKSSTVVTLKMVAKWKELMEESRSVNALHESVRAFKAAVQQTGREESEEIGKYRVEGSQVFNAVVTLCVREVPLTLQAILGLRDNKQKKIVLPSSSKKWFKVKHNVKSYLTDVIQLLSQLSEATIVSVILRHIHIMVPYYACFPKVAKHLIKKLVMLWSSAEETVRVLAFLSIFRIAFNLQDSLLEYCLKQMYMGYVRNCKFTSPNALPMINFMQRSLTELFAINTQVTYQHAFVYIRQLAIHLRNAITTKKKDTYQAIYNWQYIHSLYLWCRLLSTVHPNATLQPLIYPLVQITVGVIRLIPAARYYPLRFHCLRALNLLSEATGTFIPILPFLMEVFEQTSWNKKHSAASFKPINFAVILKLSKSQLQERSFRDGLIDQLYDMLLEHLTIHSHCIGFPELALPLIIEMKTFLKKCKVSNYCRQMKQLLEKIQENCEVINKRRDATTINLSDEKTIANWEIMSKQQGTPISKLYGTYKKLREKELIHEEAGKERIGSDEIPYIERRKQKKDQDKKEFQGLFMSSESEDSDPEEFFSKGGMGERKRKKESSDEEESDDEVSEADVSDEEDVESDVAMETKEEIGKKHRVDLKDIGEEEEDVIEELQLSSSEDEDDDDEEEEEEEEEDDDDEDDD